MIKRLSFWNMVSWFVFLLISPLFGRIDCGWFCFVGTSQDLPFGYGLFKQKKFKFIWNRKKYLAGSLKLKV